MNKLEDLHKDVIRITKIGVVFGPQGYHISHEKKTRMDYKVFLERVSFIKYIETQLHCCYFSVKSSDKLHPSGSEDVLYWDRATAIENYVRDVLSIKVHDDCFSGVTFYAIKYSKTQSIYKDVKDLLIIDTVITKEDPENAKMYDGLRSI